MRSDRPPADPDRDEEQRRLTPALVADDDELHEVIGAWGAADDGIQKHHAEIDLLTGAAEDVLCDQQWDLIDKLIAAVEAQRHELLALVARRAFEDGLRAAGVRADGDGGDDDLQHLDDDVFADTTRLGLAIDAVLQAHPGLRGLAHAVNERWNEIQRRVPRRVWREIMRVEEISTHRAASAQEVLIAWAYRAGARSARPS